MRVTDQETEVGRQERREIIMIEVRAQIVMVHQAGTGEVLQEGREIMIEVRAQIVVVHQAGTGEVLQEGRERGRRGRGRGKRRGVMIVRMGQRGLTINSANGY